MNEKPTSPAPASTWKGLAVISAPGLILITTSLVLAGQGFSATEIFEMSRVLLADQGIWGILLYAISFAVLEVVAAPSAPLIMLAAVVYGFWTGYAAVLLGMLFAMLLIEVVSRTVIGRWLLPWLQRSKKFRETADKLRKEGPFMVFLLRINPLFAFSMVSYLAGILRIKLIPYLGWSLLGVLGPVAGWLWLATYGPTLLKPENLQRAQGSAYWIGGILLLVFGLWLRKQLKGNNPPKLSQSEVPPSV